VGERLSVDGLRDSRIVITFPVPVPHNFSEAEVLGLLEKQGYTRLFGRGTPNGKSGVTLEMIQDRVRFATAERDRVIEALEAALRIGRGRVAVRVLDE